MRRVRRHSWPEVSVSDGEREALAADEAGQRMTPDDERNAVLADLTRALGTARAQCREAAMRPDDLLPSERVAAMTVAALNAIIQALIECQDRSLVQRACWSYWTGLSGHEGGAPQWVLWWLCMQGRWDDAAGIGLYDGEASVVRWWGMDGTVCHTHWLREMLRRHETRDQP